MLTPEYLTQELPLFKECIEALYVNMLPDDDAKQLSEIFRKIVPITDWGKVNWLKINKKIEVGYDPEDIIPSLEKLLNKSIDTVVYIEWSTWGIPVIKADLKRVVEVFDDVTCVSHEKFIFNLNDGYIIEVLPGSKITVGLIPSCDRTTILE